MAAPLEYAIRFAACGQQRFHFRAESIVSGAFSGQEAGALFGREIECGVEQVFHSAPAAPGDHASAPVPWGGQSCPQPAFSRLDPLESGSLAWIGCPTPCRSRLSTPNWDSTLALLNQLAIEPGFRQRPLALHGGG